MFIPKPFSQTDWQHLRDFIDNHPLAVVAAATSAGIQTAPIPLILSQNEQGEKVLIGHRPAKIRWHKRNLPNGLPYFKTTVITSHPTGIPANSKPTKKYRPGTTKAYRYAAKCASCLTTLPFWRSKPKYSNACCLKTPLGSLVTRRPNSLIKCAVPLFRLKSPSNRFRLPLN